VPTASSGSGVQEHHGAICRRLMVSARFVTIGLPGGSWHYAADLPDVSMFTSALDDCRLLCMGLFSIFWLGALGSSGSAASGRLNHPIADEATGVAWSRRPTSQVP